MNKTNSETHILIFLCKYVSYMYLHAHVCFYISNFYFYVFLFFKDQMMRKKSVMSLDSRYTTMIENAFYYCNPPEIPPVNITFFLFSHSFMQYFICENLTINFYFRLWKKNAHLCMSMWGNYYIKIWLRILKRCVS